jgi:hypothetical protein
MKRLFCLGIIIFSACILILSCSKVGGPADDNNITAIDETDDVPPVIAVTKPVANQLYSSGDSIIVEGNVTDNKKMYKGKVQIKNDVNGFMVAENYYETHFLPAINFRLAYKAVVTAPTDFSVLMDFQDHGGNPVSAIIKVKVNP